MKNAHNIVADGTDVFNIPHLDKVTGSTPTGLYLMSPQEGDRVQVVGVNIRLNADQLKHLNDYGFPVFEIREMSVIPHKEGQESWLIKKAFTSYLFDSI